MSAAPAHYLDLTAPPVVKTISQRSLMVGVVFGMVAVILAFFRPEQFFRAYLLGFMCWLGVALGSMAILMIRHLTGGGWGMVIRRILGAAMRTVPLLALLFIPVILGMHKLYIWAQPLDQVADKHLASISKDHHQDISHHERLRRSRHRLFRHLESALVLAVEMVQADRSSRRTR